MKNSVVLEDLQDIFDHFPERFKLEGATIFVTGCAGFLGYYLLHFFTHFAEQLKIKRVIATDNFSLGFPKWLEELKRFPLLSVVGFNIVTDNLFELLKEIEVDYVLHMVSIASPPVYRQYPLETIDANVWGLRHLLEYFNQKKLKGFLFFSSSEIYGDPECIPTKEDYLGSVSCVGPRACYDESKRFGETLCWVYAEKYQMPITIVRPFNNYGPGMKLDDGRIPADLAKSVLAGEDIILFSDGTPTRTFCYITDAIVGYLKALTFGRFDFFNIGMDKPEISMHEFAKIFQARGQKILGYQGAIVLRIPKDKNYLIHNPSRRCPNIDKARNLLGFQPRIEVEQGIEKLLKFWKAE